MSKYIICFGGLAAYCYLSLSIQDPEEQAVKGSSAVVHSVTMQKHLQLSLPSILHILHAIHHGFRSFFPDCLGIFLQRGLGATVWLGGNERVLHDLVQVAFSFLCGHSYHDIQIPLNRQCCLSMPASCYLQGHCCFSRPHSPLFFFVSICSSNCFTSGFTRPLQFCFFFFS